jgi:hypothetical protein
MYFPEFEYGIYKDVLSNCRKKVTALSRGRTWDEVTSGPFVDTQALPGLIVLHGPSALLGGSPHFHAFTLHMVIQEAFGKGRLQASMVESIFARSLRSAWGLVGLLAQTNMIWAYPEHRHKPVLDACLYFWDSLVGEGARYTCGSATGATLWELHSNLKMVLSNLGVPTPVLNAPLAGGDLRSILGYVEETKGLQPDLNT